MRIIELAKLSSQSCLVFLIEPLLSFIFILLLII